MIKYAKHVTKSTRTMNVNDYSQHIDEIKNVQ